MRTTEHIDAVRREGELLAEASARAGLASPVPTCPGWRVSDLLAHLGGVHRWATHFLITGASRPSTDEQDAEFFAAPGADRLLWWYRDAHAALVTALSAADPALDCWSFLPAPSPLAFWARRQAHETAIHRADAEAALRATGAAAETSASFDPAFATDGIDELLCGFLARPRGRLVSDPPVRVGVHAADTGAAWTVHIGPDGRVVRPEPGPADLTLRGPAGELYLLLWNRTGTDRIDVDGDAALLDLWRAAATVRWG